MIRISDDLGRTIELGLPARRIVSLVPSITETLFALGAGDRIVGITDYCVHPRVETSAKTRVGGTKDFAISKILALEPDLVVANAEENRKHQTEALQKAGLKVLVTFPKTVDGCVKMIGDLGTVTGAVEAARSIVDSIERARAQVLSRAAGRPLRVLCPIWKNPYMTINRDTYIDSVIRTCGGENLFANSAERYPQFTLEEAAQRRPEAVLLPTEPYHFNQSHTADFERMGKEVPAARDRRIHIVEGELLSWYGPRLARALTEISDLILGRPHTQW